MYTRKAGSPTQRIGRLQGFIPLLHRLDCFLVFGRFCGYRRDSALGAEDPRVLEKTFGRDTECGVLLEALHEEFTQKLQGLARGRFRVAGTAKGLLTGDALPGIGGCSSLTILNRACMGCSLWYGGFPSISSITVHPRLHMSDEVVAPESSMTSGAIQ